MNKQSTIAANLLLIAIEIHNNPSHRGAIADGFELIAGLMDPCEDCDHPSFEAGPLPAPAIVAAELPTIEQAA